VHSNDVQNTYYEDECPRCDGDDARPFSFWSSTSWPELSLGGAARADHGAGTGPATWREVMSTLDSTFAGRAAGMRLAVQEYGASNRELLSELVTRFDEVTKVPVYQWALPEDLEPLRNVVREIVRGSIHVALFMTAVQVIHLFQVADGISMQDDLKFALNSVVVISVGPTTTEELQQHGVQPDYERSRPKMGFLINEAAQYAGKLLAAKRAPRPPEDLSAAPLPAVAPPRAGARTPPASGVQQAATMTSTMAGFKDGLAPLDILHEISSRIALADPLHLVVERIVKFACAVIPCDSCFVYTLENEQLVLRASKNAHADEVDTLNVPVGEGITGRVAKHRESVAIPKAASEDPRFSFFALLPEDRFEAMLCTPTHPLDEYIGLLSTPEVPGQTASQKPTSRCSVKLRLGTTELPSLARAARHHY
jgi:uroporphyrinogen-III synthase